MQKHLQLALIQKGGSGSKGVVTKLLDCPAYRLKYDNLHARLHAKGLRCTDGSTDPQDNTAESTYNREEWLKLNIAWLSKGTPAACRDQAFATLAHNTVGRSDDVRAFYLADVVAPRLYANIGAMLCQSCLLKTGC